MAVRFTLYAVVALSSMVFGLTADLVYAGVLAL